MLFLKQSASAENSYTSSGSYPEADIYVNGNLYLYGSNTDTARGSLIYDGILYVSLQDLCDALGMPFNWDNESNSIYIGEQENDDADIVEVTVNTADEFISALGSNTRILLEEGVYNLSEVVQDNTINSAINWSRAYDGSELNLSQLSNLSIIGIGGNPSEIIIEPRYAYVLSFIDCSNIEIENIKAGHTDSGDCYGGVFKFTRCSDIFINDTQMYGCGTEGLAITDVRNMSVVGSTIYECKNDIMIIINARDILFDYCVFRDNGRDSLSLVSIYDTYGFAICNCEFISNKAVESVFYISGSKELTVVDSVFTDNEAQSFGADSIPNFDLANTFSGNSF